MHVTDKTHAHSIFSHDLRCQVLDWFKERQNIVAGVLAWQLVDNEYKSQYYEGEPLSLWEMGLCGLGRAHCVVRPHASVPLYNTQPQYYLVIHQCRRVPDGGGWRRPRWIGCLGGVCRKLLGSCTILTRSLVAGRCVLGSIISGSRLRFRLIEGCCRVFVLSSSCCNGSQLMTTLSEQRMGAALPRSLAWV